MSPRRWFTQLPCFAKSANELIYEQDKVRFGGIPVMYGGLDSTSVPVKIYTGLIVHPGGLEYIKFYGPDGDAKGFCDEKLRLAAYCFKRREPMRDYGIWHVKSVDK